MKYRILAALLLIGAVGLLPFLFRKENPVSENTSGADVLVIISPHSEPVKYEFERGFREYYRKRFNRDIRIDFRAPGGTSDIVRYIADRYTAEFRMNWEKDPSNPPWDRAIASGFADPKTDRDPSLPESVRAARKNFLASEVGIGIDLFAGGGTFEHARTAARGFAVDGGLQKRHPEYFGKEIMPCAFSGDHIYDPKGRYYGVTLSSFGICYNSDRLKELSDPVPPKKWGDLAHGRFFGTLCVADPTKSGSANKSYEIIIQQAMHEVIPANVKRPSSDQLDAAWAYGVNRIKRIFANSRTITDSAGSVTGAVAAGEACAGTAIDFYGLSERDWNSLQLSGKPVVHYVAPEGGTAISADPVQMLRGAPHRKEAEAFLDYIIGPEGQKLVCFKRGTPGGPVKYELRHSPVRRDLYAKKYYSFRSDPDYFPYEAAQLSFTYRPEWTGRYFSLIRILIRCIALDVRDELREAWGAILAAGGPEAVPEAMKEFSRLPFAYHEASQAGASLRPSGSRSVLDTVAVCRKWSDDARRQYKRAAELARKKR